MKKINKTLLVILGVSIMTACASGPSEKQDTNTTSKNETTTEKPASTNGLGITDERYAASIEFSLLNAGNNYLLKNVLEKLKKGEENVYIAALGGSVTEGAGPSIYTDGYAYQFSKMIKENFAADPSKVVFDGAGIGGTPSPMGLIRYEKDVIKVLGQRPDLLLIEFAVNDWQECSNTRAFEYLIRDSISNGTAVIAVYAAATYGNQQAAMSPVAKFYNIPEVSVSNALDYSGINKDKNSGIYYTDMVHPTKKGHKFMADCIMNLIQKADAAEINEPPVVPENYKNNNPFVEFYTVYGDTEDSNVKIMPGAFSKKDTLIQSYMKGGKSFPENWYNDGTSNEAFEMEITCKSLIIVFKDSNSKTFGKANVIVDGNPCKELNGCDGQGWNNCSVVMLIDENESSKHTVSIKAEESKAFTILAFGYSK